MVFIGLSPVGQLLNVPQNYYKKVVYTKKKPFFSGGC